MATWNPFANLFAAKGRPRAIEGEDMVIGWDLMASANRPVEGGVYFVPVDEIIRRHGWKIYKDMLFDDQIKTCLEFKKILIHGRTWNLLPADKTPAAKEVAEFVDFNLRKRLDFNKTVREALSCLEFGYSIAEIVWGRDDYNGQQMVMLNAVKHRDPEWMYIEADFHGNFLGARQLGTYNWIDLPAEKLWHFAHDQRFGNNYGNSDLRAAYRSWWAKKFVINFWNVYLERMGSPMTAVKYPVGASQIMKDNLKNLLKNLSTKTEILIPEGVEIELIEAKRAGTPDYEAALSYHDNAIARAILMVSLLGAGGEKSGRGTDSQNRLHLRTLFKLTDEIAQSLIDSFMNQVVKQLVDFNFPGQLYPRFVWQDYGGFEGVEIADKIRLLHAAGVLDMNQDDVNYARSILGLPIRLMEDTPDKVIRPPQPPPPGSANAPPPPAEQGNGRATKQTEEIDIVALAAEFAKMGQRDITVNPPNVTVNPPNITINTPEVTVTPPNVTVNQPEIVFNQAPVTVNVDQPDTTVTVDAGSFTEALLDLPDEE